MLQAQDAQALQGLAHHLAERTTVLLDRIRRAVTEDPEISTARALARAEFFDSLPEVLAAFGQRLSAAAAGTPPPVRAEPERAPARRHGGHRFEQGYSLPESVREWRHVSACLIESIGDYACERQLAPQTLSVAMRELSELVSDGIVQSAQRHLRLQQRAAARRSEELQAALERVRTIEHQRARTWRQAVHDLRGSVGAIANASALLQRQTTPMPLRELSHEALNRGLTSVREMLNDLSSLARLEAGQEPLRVSPFDAAEALSALASTVRPLALMRGLRLETAGPVRLEVEGDPVKVRRIAQNLLLNALRYTDEGCVGMSWDTAPDDPSRWCLTVHDSGPGFEVPAAQAVPDSSQDEALSSAGEGIGLSIVRQLCDMLGADIELDSGAGRGSTFRVSFPVRYTRPASDPAQPR